MVRIKASTVVAFAIVMFITYNDLLVDIDHRNVATQQLQGSKRATSDVVGEDKEKKIRVLIARTVSSAEIPNVVADVKRINSYLNSNDQQRLQLIATDFIKQENEKTDVLHNALEVFKSKYLKE